MSAELMKSKFVRRPCRNYLNLRTYWADFFQLSVVASPGPYTHTFFNLKKAFPISKALF